MPIVSSWADDSKTVLINAFSQTWTWDEFVASVLNCWELIRPVDHTVYPVAKGFTDTPKGNAMLAFKRVENLPPNLGLLILQSDRTNAIAQVLTNVFLRVYGTNAGKVVYVRSMEDAYRIIEKRQQRAPTEPKAS